MSDTIQDLYSSFSEQMEPIQADDRYFRYLYEMAQAGETTLEQKREVLAKVVDEEWIQMVEDSLDSINAIIEKPRRFITTEEEVVPVSLAKKISADSVRHLSQNTQFLAPSDDGGIHPTRILNVQNVETYDLYENRFVYHLIQRLLAFVDKRTDVIFWSTGNEIRNRFRMHSKIDDAYEEIEYNVEMTVKNRQSFAENDADNMDVFMRIDRVRRLVMALRSASFCQIMAGCSKVRSPIQRTNLIMKDPDYRKCYELWQFMERYDEVGYTIDVQDTEMAFDDEYMVQMYTNLINNYAVFKSLTEDERALEELESTHREPVRPKFVKEIKEEIVDSPDIPDVEIRRVFVEEVTQAQLDAEAALEQERAAKAELEEQLRAWKAQVNALSDEKDDLADELDEVQTALTMAKNEISVARAAEQDAKDDAEEARTAMQVAEERSAAAQADAAEQIVRAQSELADAQADLAAARKHAAEKVEALKAEAAEELAGVRAEAEEQVRAAQEAADAAVATARADADAAVAGAHAEADAAMAEARENAETLVAESQAAADKAVAAAEERAERQVANAEGCAAKRVADAEARAESEVAQAHASQAAAEERAAEAEEAGAKALAEAREEADRMLAEARESAAAELAAAKAEAEGTIAELRAELERSERERERAQRKADSNSLGKYLLARIRHEEVPLSEGSDVDEVDGSDGDAER